MLYSSLKGSRSALGFPGTFCSTLVGVARFPLRSILSKAAHHHTSACNCVRVRIIAAKSYPILCCRSSKSRAFCISVSKWLTGLNLVLTAARQASRDRQTMVAIYLGPSLRLSCAPAYTKTDRLVPYSYSLPCASWTTLGMFSGGTIRDAQCTHVFSSKLRIRWWLGNLQPHLERGLQAAALAKARPRLPLVVK